MIIDFRNIGGGGGSGYTLPVATSSVLGGVMIGDGISVDSAGTISVTGGTGGGVEVVTSLPASGTDGQMVLLDTVIPEKHIKVYGTASSDLITTVTATGITTKTLLFKYWYYQEYVDVFVNPDNSITLESETSGTNITVAVGETDSFEFSSSYHNNTVQVEPSSTGCVFTLGSGCDKTSITTIDQNTQEIQILYTWSDFPELTADVDMTTSDKGPWCYRVKYDIIPSGSTILVSKYQFQDKWFHYVYENGGLHIYGSDSAETYTATTYTNVPQYTNYDSPVSYDDTYIYWTDDEIVFYSDATWCWRYSYNNEIFYKTGWHKDGVHRIDKNAFYKDFTFYDFDYNIIIKNANYGLNDVGFKLNPTASYSTPYYVYSKNNSTIGPFFAPTTTGQTGYVCVAGNGWAAPTWVAPETLTNGVKFWKGTQVEYDALSASTGYDSSTLYIITDSGSNVI